MKKLKISIICTRDSMLKILSMNTRLLWNILDESNLFIFYDKNLGDSFQIFIDKYFLKTNIFRESTFKQEEQKKLVCKHKTRIPSKVNFQSLDILRRAQNLKKSSTSNLTLLTMSQNRRSHMMTSLLSIFDFQIFFWLKFILGYYIFIG